MAADDVKSGLVEIPRVYRAKRFEYWHDDVLLVYAVYDRDTSDDQLWTIYVHTGILKALDLPNGSWRDQFKGRISGYDVEKWVLGLGAVFKAWAIATGNLTVLRNMNVGENYTPDDND